MMDRFAQSMSHEASKRQPHGNMEAIQVCYDLLSSAHSLPEILTSLKRLGPLNKVQSDVGVARSEFCACSAVHDREIWGIEKWSLPVRTACLWSIPAMSRAK